MQIEAIGMPIEEATQYAEMVAKKHPGRELTRVTVTADGEYANVEYRYREPGLPFERIRRITGYLVGTLDHFNNAKRAEERERVKHGLEQA